MNDQQFTEAKLDTQPGVWFPENTPDKVRAMYGVYCEGYSLRQLAGMYGMSHQGVAYHFKRWQLPLRVQGYPTEADKWQEAE